MDELVNNIAREIETLAGQVLPAAKTHLEDKFPAVGFEVKEKYVKAVIGDKVRWFMFDFNNRVNPILAA